ncbi:MAG TPA: DNA cytosine methyltransferase [Sphingomonas sp.]|jgi:DNA (cytosine-5)-methyltransferase 1|uniref:DNA cytosine methyltransferase n=1 Tax=Sphingomonas sp. TaxID=28214 RepID=UPI002EDA6E35
MTLIELFCGTGGFSRGAHAAGFQVAVAYDIDKILTSSYRRNFPATQLYHRDVAALTGREIRAHAGAEIDGVFGGPPCQGFSEVGKRDPSDPRRSLLDHFFRIVAEIQPKFFVMENVRGLNFPRNRPVLDAALSRVNDQYDVLTPHIRDAAEFGAATSRPRLVVIGIRKNLRRPLAMSDLDAMRSPGRATVRQAINDLWKAIAIEDHADLPGFDRWKAAGRGRPTNYVAQLRSKDRSFTGHRVTVHTPAVIARFAKVPPGKMEKVGRHPRLKLDGLCPTLRAGTGSELGSFQSVRPIHPYQNRVITVREAARLQGFPDEHVFHPTVWHSFRMIGNSVSPMMARGIFEAIRDRLSRPEEATIATSSPAKQAFVSVKRTARGDARMAEAAE